MNDPTVAESVRLRRRIAELEQVVRELRQRQPPKSSSTSAPTISSNTVTTTDGPFSSYVDEAGDTADEKGQGRRRVIIDRFARIKIDEAAMQAVAASAGVLSDINGRPSTAGSAGSHVRSMPVGGGHSRDDSRDDLSPTDEDKSRDVDENIEVIGKDGRRGSRDKGKAETRETRGTKDYRTEPYTTYLLPGEEMVSDSTGQRTFLGASAGKSMLRRVSISFLTPSTSCDKCRDPTSARFSQSISPWHFRTTCK